MNCGNVEGVLYICAMKNFWWIKTGLPKKDNFTFSQIIVHCSSAHITPIVYPKENCQPGQPRFCCMPIHEVPSIPY